MAPVARFQRMRTRHFDKLSGLREPVEILVFLVVTFGYLEASYVSRLFLLLHSVK